MNKLILPISVIIGVLASLPAVLSAGHILSLDASRTGSGLSVGDDRYLTSTSMADATQILLDAGFTIGITSVFDAANIAGADVLYTGAVDIDFTAQEIADIQAFVDAGGGLVVHRDWGNYYPAVDPLAAVFGAMYDPGPFGVAYSASAVDMTAMHPIWDGPAGSVTTYDQVYSSSVSGVTGIGEHSSFPGQVGLAVTTFGAGRVVFLTDGDAWDSVEDPVTPLPGNNNGIVWENIFHWAIPEPGTVLLLGLGGLIMRRLKFKNFETF